MRSCNITTPTCGGAQTCRASSPPTVTRARLAPICSATCGPNRGSPWWPTPLLKGGYARPEKPLDPAFDHPGTPARLAALREVAKDAGATVNQVVLAWLIGAEVPMIPLVGASSVAQLDESLAAVDLELTAGQRARLGTAR